MALTKVVNGKTVTLKQAEEDLVKGQWADEDARKAKYIAEEKYKDDRRKAYPDVEDQLDALWHAMDKGLTMLIPDFYDPIKAVKDQFPKPVIVAEK